MGNGIQLGYVVAIIIDLLLGLISTMGFILQRKSHLQTAVLPSEQRKPSYKRPLWHVGFWTYVIFSTASSIVDLGNIPFFVIIPLGSSKLIYNAIYSKYFLHETITRNAILGTFYVAISAVVIGICGSIPEPERTIDDMYKMYAKPEFIVFESCLAFGLIVCLFILHVGRPFSTRAKGIIYGIIATTFSSQAALFAKAGLSLLNLTIFQHQNQFTSFIAFFLLTLMIVLPLIGLFFFNKSLARCETVVSIPITYCVGISLAVLNTVSYYDHLTHIAPWKWGVIALASMYLVYGVSLLSMMPLNDDDVASLRFETDSIVSMHLQNSTCYDDASSIH